MSSITRRNLLRSLSAAPFISGIPAAAAQSGRMPRDLRLSRKSNYTRGKYNSWSGMYKVDLPPYVPGVDWDARWEVDPQTFPNGSRLDWKVPFGPIPGFGVWGYPQIAFGNYDGGATEKPVTSSRINDILRMNVQIDWDFLGSPNFGALHELWLTRDSRYPNKGSSGDAEWEIGFFLHEFKDAREFHDSGKVIGNFVNDVANFTVRLNGKNYITLMSSEKRDVLKADLNWKAVWNLLVNTGYLTGDEWFNGVAFGPEPGVQETSSGRSGTFLIKTIDARIEYRSGELP